MKKRTPVRSEWRGASDGVTFTDSSTCEKGRKMGPLRFDILEKLDKEDQQAVAYFLRLLLNKAKYRTLKEEIEQRRREIENGDTLSHNEIWDQLDV